MLGAEKHAFDVDVHNLIPFGLAKFVGGLVGTGDTGVVYQHRDRAEGLDDTGVYLRDLIFLSDIQVPELSAAAVTQPVT